MKGRGAPVMALFDAMDRWTQLLATLYHEPLTVQGGEEGCGNIHIYDERGVRGAQ